MKYIIGIFFLGLMQPAFAQYINYGFDSEAIVKSEVVGLFSESDSVYRANLDKAKKNWLHFKGFSILPANTQAKLDLSAGRVFVIPVAEKISDKVFNYKLVLCVAGKGFVLPVASEVKGYYKEPANAVVVCALYVNPERLHSGHFPFLLGALSSMVKYPKTLKNDMERDMLLMKNYYYEGLKNVVFEQADLDTVIKTQQHLQRGVPYGLIATERMWRDNLITEPVRRAVAYIVEQHRKNEESLIHRYFVVTGQGMTYLEIATATEHPSDKFTVKDIFKYGTPISEGANK